MADHANVTADLVAVDKTTAVIQKAQQGFQKYADGIKNQLSTIQGKFAAFSAASTGIMAYFSGEAANKMLMTAKAAQQLGTSVEQMQAIVVASGKGVEDLTPALLHMNAQLGEAKMGGQMAQESFGRLGVSLQDLASKSGKNIFAEILKQLGAIRDPAERAAMAMKLFGREGQQAMMGLISKGPEAIAEAAKKIKDQGIGFKSEDIDRIKKAREAMESLKRSMEAFGQHVASAVAPTIKKVADALTDLTGWFNKLSAGWLKGAAGAVGLVAALSPVALVVGKVIGAMKLLVVELVATAAHWMKLAVAEAAALAMSGPAGIAAVVAGVAAVGVAVYALSSAYQSWARSADEAAAAADRANKKGRGETTSRESLQQAQADVEKQQELMRQREEENTEYNRRAKAGGIGGNSFMQNLNNLYEQQKAKDQAKLDALEVRANRRQAALNQEERENRQAAGYADLQNVNKGGMSEGAGRLQESMAAHGMGTTALKNELRDIFRQKGEVDQFNAALQRLQNVAYGIDPKPLETFKQALDQLEKDRQHNAISAETYDAVREKMKEAFSVDPVAKYAKEVELLTQKMKLLGMSAEEIAKAKEKLAESTFGGLASETTGDKYNKGLQEILRGYTAGFGRFDMATEEGQAGANKENDARLKQLQDQTFGEAALTPIQAYQKRLKELIPLTGEGAAAQARWNALVKDAKKKLDEATGAAAIKESTKTPAEHLAEQQKKLKELYSMPEGGIDRETFLRGMMQSIEQFGPQGTPFKPAQFEGLQEGWHRIQAIAGGVGGDKDAKQAEAFAKAAKAQLGGGATTKDLLDWWKQNYKAMHPQPAVT